ncbi:helix-turn-helix transcriptional regulator [Streptomyces sp. WMMC500]|uniref:helix-turn-helix transcriptional regulator n=1 Tax=Streptomyces sp. WMMC500 TaxID=3015154 RepID=UPI00248CAF67|nr:helix-turn-helix transcriptional regulator [Streptomyces sp. WMMC500]WBB62027.1 helix-turn-helix transcriptional regulator [Streptomyces sp. WMMC500]
MNHHELGNFLRARRDALRPTDVGLAPGGPRRTPGLRRSEVALLANVSVDYYERLEQGRAGHPSRRLLDALARALRLSADERNYLHVLAGYPPPARFSVTPQVEQGMLFLLDSLTNAPAHVINDLTTVLAQNALSVRLLGPWAQQTGRQANLIWRWFTQPAARSRDFLEDDEETGRAFVADLRMASAARGCDRVSGELIADLKAASAEFSSLWGEMGVEPIRSVDKTLVHDELGRLDVCCTVLSATASRRLIVFRPQPGTATAERFASLRTACQGSPA